MKANLELKTSALQPGICNFTNLQFRLAVSHEQPSTCVRKKTWCVSCFLLAASVFQILSSPLRQESFYQLLCFNSHGYLAAPLLGLSQLAAPRRCPCAIVYISRGPGLGPDRQHSSAEALNISDGRRLLDSYFEVRRMNVASSPCPGSLARKTRARAMARALARALARAKDPHSRHHR